MRILEVFSYFGKLQASQQYYHIGPQVALEESYVSIDDTYEEYVDLIGVFEDITHKYPNSKVRVIIEVLSEG